MFFLPSYAAAHAAKQPLHIHMKRDEVVVARVDSARSSMSNSGSAVPPRAVAAGSTSSDGG
jgi:hypothetical protein